MLGLATGLLALPAAAAAETALDTQSGGGLEQVAVTVTVTVRSAEVARMEPIAVLVLDAAGHRLLDHDPGSRLVTAALQVPACTRIPLHQ